MRRFASPFFAAIGVVCVYLFATGVILERPSVRWDLLDRALAPFRSLTLTSGIVLATAAVAFILAFSLRTRVSWESGQVQEISWSRVFQVAFLSEVVLVAAILLLLFLAGSGCLPGTQPAVHTLGALYVVAIAEAALGTLLAVGLLFVRRSTFLYLSTVAIHAVELCLIGVVFFLGYSA